MARGSIRQRSKVRKDSWTVQAYMGRDPSTGKKRYRSEAVRGTRAQAERRLTEILREIDMGSSVPKPSGLTVGEYLEGWLRDPMEARVRLRTLEGYQLHVRGNIVPRIGAVPLGRLTVRQVQDMEADLLRSGGRDGRGLSPRTVIHVHRVLYTALKHALRLELVSRNVAAAVQPPRAPRYQARTLTWDEARSFFAGGVPNVTLFRSIFLLAFQIFLLVIRVCVGRKSWVCNGGMLTFQEDSCRSGGVWSRCPPTELCSMIPSRAGDGWWTWGVMRSEG